MLCCYTSYTPIQVQSTNETSKLWFAVHVWLKKDIRKLWEVMRWLSFCSFSGERVFCKLSSENLWVKTGCPWLKTGSMNRRDYWGSLPTSVSSELWGLTYSQRELQQSPPSGLLTATVKAIQNPEQIFYDVLPVI